MKTSLEQKTIQKNKILKAKVALAMRDEFGKVPKEEATEEGWAAFRMQIN
jgi:hypothetical protein